MVLMDPTKSYDPSQWFSVSKLYDPRAQAAVHYKPSNAVNQPPPPQHHLLADPRLKNSKTLVQDEYGTYELQQGSTNSQKNSSFVPAPAPAATEQSDKDKREKYDPRKLEYYISSLQTMVTSLAPQYKVKFPYDMICQLAHAVLDGTVFEITKGLQDIQAITEQNLKTKRQKMVNEQKLLKSDMLSRHQTELSLVQNKQHQKSFLEKQQKEEKALYQQRCDKELNSLDQRLVLELDRQTSDQQATLQRAGLPFFYITNEPEDIKLQMYVLSFIIRLSSASSGS